jgi:hypothetical protein
MELGRWPLLVSLGERLSNVVTLPVSLRRGDGGLMEGDHTNFPLIDCLRTDVLP